MKFSLITKFLAATLALFFTLDLAVAQEDVPFEYVGNITNLVSEPVEPAWLAFCLDEGFHGAFKSYRTGTAIHLGNFTSVERGCLDFSLFPIVQSRNVVTTATAANGDELWFRAEADFDFSDPPEFIWGIFEIDGGTGRFENATGGGQVLDGGTGVPGEVLILVGTISFEASDRRHRGN